MIRAAGALLLAVGIAGASVMPAVDPVLPSVEQSPAATTTPSPTPSPTPTADPVRAAEYWLRSSGVTEAWKTTRGKGVRIAVIDSGVAKVPELNGAVVGGTVGAIVSGMLFDATGSFASTWIVCLACSVVMLVFLLASEPIAAKLRASVAGE